jgi:formate dehydrogenase major subunit/NADH-quinone oxidoreductase subunit G
MPDTFELTIDGKTITADGDQTILKAAWLAGITIPTLCFDPRLQPFGACRLCLVEVEQMKGRLIPACSTPVTKGMIVRTQTDDVRKARRMVLELLLVHHPLDCPVCDKAGECKLQDAVFEYGADKNRMLYGQVRFHETIEAKSPLIERDTNRCILCGLCVRACDEVQSVGEISFVGRGFPAKIGTCFDKPLDCEFCGQCIAICPVGALNSKGFKHKARVWDLESTQTTCAYCGVGCTVQIQARRGRIQRVKARLAQGINLSNLCGKGRYGWEYVHDEARLTTPLVRKDGRLVPAPWGEAIAAAAKGMKDAVTRHGAGAVAGIASCRVTNEEAFLFARLMKETLGVPSADTAASHTVGPMLAQAKRQLGQASSTTTFADVPLAKSILVVNSSTQESNPVLGNRIVHAKRFDEASLVTIHPRRTKMARFADVWIEAGPEAAADVLTAMAAAIVAGGTADPTAESRAGFAAFRDALAGFAPAAIAAKWKLSAAAIEDAAARFAAGPGIVVLGAAPFADAVNAKTAAAAIDLLLLTGNLGKPGAGLLVMGEKNNMQGVLDAGLVPGEGGKRAREIVGALDAGDLKALYLVGENVVTNFPGGGAKRAEALAKLDFLVVHELFLTETAKRASVVFPAAAAAERGGSFTNSERRQQRVRKAVDSPGQARPDGDILLAVAKALGADWPYATGADALGDLVRGIHGDAGMTVKGIPEAGVLCQRDLAGGLPESAAGFVVPDGTPAPAATDGYPLALEIGTVLYHSGTLSVRSPQLKAVFPGAIVELSAQDAKTLAVKGGETVNIASPAGTIAALAKVGKNVQPGRAFVPFHFEDAPAFSLMGTGDEAARVKVTK